MQDSSLFSRKLRDSLMRENKLDIGASAEHHKLF